MKKCAARQHFFNCLILNPVTAIKKSIGTFFQENATGIRQNLFSSPQSLNVAPNANAVYCDASKLENDAIGFVGIPPDVSNPNDMSHLHKISPFAVPIVSGNKNNDISRLEFISLILAVNQFRDCIEDPDDIQTFQFYSDSDTALLEIEHI